MSDYTPSNPAPAAPLAVGPDASQLLPPEQLAESAELPSEINKLIHLVANAYFNSELSPGEQLMALGDLCGRYRSGSTLKLLAQEVAGLIQQLRSLSATEKMLLRWCATGHPAAAAEKTEQTADGEQPENPYLLGGDELKRTVDHRILRDA